MLDFKRHRFPGTAIIMAVRWYLRYRLSLEDITELILERGVNVSRETVREWVQKFGPTIAVFLDKKRRRVGGRWHVDETYVKVAGVWKYVYRAVDDDMEVIDIYVSENRDKAAAKKFFKKCRKTAGRKPFSVWSDSHQGYDQTKKLFPKVRHYKIKCLNNKVESSHVPLKQRYRPMRGFKNIDRMRIFLESFESLYRFFRKVPPKNRNMRDVFKEKLQEFNALLCPNYSTSSAE
jgi:transposase-like protein